MVSADVDGSSLMPAPRVKILDLYGNVVVGAFASGVRIEANQLNKTKSTLAEASKFLQCLRWYRHIRLVGTACALVRARTFCGLMRLLRWGEALA